MNEQEVAELLQGDLVPEADAPAGLTNYGTAGFYGDALFDDKGRTAFIKEVVSQVRKCPEYARYRSFLLENLDMGRCAILSNLNEEEVGAAGLELHHCPLTLYDICELVLGQMQVDEMRITTFAVANRVMAYHWRGMVGLVPLTGTLHEAVHAGQLYVDPRSIFGNWQMLLDENRSGLTEHLVEKLRAMSSTWGTEEAAEANARALQVSLQKWTLNAPTAANLLGAPQTVAETPDDSALE